MVDESTAYVASPEYEATNENGVPVVLDGVQTHEAEPLTTVTTPDVPQLLMADPFEVKVMVPVAAVGIVAESVIAVFVGCGELRLLEKVTPVDFL